MYFFTVKHSGDVPISEMIKIARIVRDRSMSKDLAGTLKECLGTAQSVGCTVDGKHPHAVIEGINSGDYSVPDVSY